MSPLELTAYLIAGVVGLIATLTLIVMVVAEHMDRERDEQRFKHLLQVAADLDSHDPLERLFERESYQR